MTPSDGRTLGGVDVGSPLLREALINSLIDGSLCSVMTALAETFSIAAAVRLNAPAMTIALLGSAPLLAGSIGQFVLPLFLRAGRSRKRYIVGSVRVQATFLIFAAAAGWLPAPWNSYAYVAAFVLYGSSGNLCTGVWTSWLRDCVPAAVRGRHFAWRNRFFNLIQMASAVSAGIISRKYSSQNAPWALFAGIFFTASLFRFGSGHFLSRQYDPRPGTLPQKSQVLRFRPSKPFLRFIAAIALFQGGTAVAGPFFNVWFLRDLRMDYLTFTLCTAGTVLGSVAFLPFWGRLIDTLGTSRALRITGILCTLVPLPYLFASNPVALWAFNFYSGAVWAGFNIANLKHLLNVTEKEKSDHYIAFASAATALATFACCLLGGFLSTRLPVLFKWHLQSLFLVSFALRAGVALALFGVFAKEEIPLGPRAMESMHEGAHYRIGMEALRSVLGPLRIFRPLWSRPTTRGDG